ncbi:MAG: ATP-binding protein, partial [Dehalococcoidia bacterium]
MEQFRGFPAKMQFTALPNLFFSTLLPQISDIAELKVTLYLLATLHRRRGYPRFVSRGELLGSTSLMRGFSREGEPAAEALARALEMATRRGTILHLALDKGGATEDVYFLNTESDRETVARIQSGKLSLPGLKTGGQSYPAPEEPPILKNKTPINTSKADTDTWSSASQTEGASQDTACPVCQGAGFVHPVLPTGKPDFSRVIHCRCTQETRDKERKTHLLRYSNLGALARFTFDNLLPQGKSGDPKNQELFSRACEAAQAFAREPKGWLILAGPSSSGKTHLAAAIANARIRQARPALFISTPDLLDRLRSAYSPTSEIPYDEFFDQVRSAPLLILDDLGAQAATPWAKEKLDQLLNYRF